MSKKQKREAVSSLHGGTATVRRHYERHGRVTRLSNEVLSAADDAVLRVRKFISTPAKVGMHIGGTFPTPTDYESARVDVTLELPCYPEEKDECFLHVKKWLRERFDAEVVDLELKAEKPKVVKVKGSKKRGA